MTLRCPYSQTFAFISEITSKYPNIHFDFHAHNDYDLSIANVISYKSRYKGLHVTVNGMGERGNAPLESTVAVINDFLPEIKSMSKNPHYTRSVN
jgi:D-citramalate synthase